MGLLFGCISPLFAQAHNRHSKVWKKGCSAHTSEIYVFEGLRPAKSARSLDSKCAQGAQAEHFEYAQKWELSDHPTHTVTGRRRAARYNNGSTSPARPPPKLSRWPA